MASSILAHVSHPPPRAFVCASKAECKASRITFCVLGGKHLARTLASPPETPASTSDASVARNASSSASALSPHTDASATRPGPPPVA